MSSRKINHIAVAVRDLGKAKYVFAQLLGGKATETIEVPDQKVKVSFVGDEGTRLELISPAEGNRSIAGFLDKRGDGLHHICLEVDDIEAVLEECRAAGIRLIDEKPRIGAEGHKIAFLHPASCGGVLIELEESA